MDVGFATEQSSYPLINREHVRALGGHYSLEIQGDRYRSSWTIGEKHLAHGNSVQRRAIRSVQVEKTDSRWNWTL